MVDIQSAAAEIRRGKKKDRRKKPQGKNIMPASATQGGHNKWGRFQNRIFGDNRHRFAFLSPNQQRPGSEEKHKQTVTFKFFWKQVPPCYYYYH